MLEVAAVFAVLLGFSTMAGYAPVRLLGRGLPSADRVAAMPLAGAALISLVAVWLHCFTPYRGVVVYISLLPVIGGVALILVDAFRRRLSVPQVPVIILWVLSAVLALMPFLVLGGPTTFGLYSNDGFWWTIADHLVQSTTHGGSSDSNMVQRSTEFRRFGANYLSVIAQYVTGLRSWEAVHISGAFGLFLVAQAGWLLARTFRTWWPVAVVIALVAAGNHFVYRTFLDALIGFQFGLAYLMATVALGWRPFGLDWRPRAALIALFVSGIGTFYTEFLPLVGAVAGAGLAGMFAAGRLRSRQVVALAISGLGGVVLLGPLVINILHHIGFIAGFQLPVALYHKEYVWGNLLHFTGMMDHMQYSVGPAAAPIQYVGFAAMLLVAAGAAMYSGAQRWYPLGAVLFLLLAAFRFFMGRNQEYTAHRFAVVMAPFAAVVLFAFLQRYRKIWLAVAAIAVVCGVFPAYNMVSFLPGNYIRVTDQERQIGDEWLPKFAQQGSVLIDLPEDLNLFYGHYMYWEALHGLRGDEKRIVYSGPTYSFVPSSPFSSPDVRYVLRRKALGSAVGSWKVAASNDRYELLELRSPGEVAVVKFAKNFHGMEIGGNDRGIWMDQDGLMVASVPRALTLRFQSGVNRNPRLPSTTVKAAAGDKTLAELPVPPGTTLEFTTPLKSGDNHIILHSSTPSVDPGNGDTRKMSVQLINPEFRVSGL